MARVRFAHPDAIRTCRVRDERGAVVDQDWMPVGVSPPHRDGVFRLAPDDYIVADAGLDPRSVFASSEPSPWLAEKVSEQWSHLDTPTSLRAFLLEHRSGTSIPASS